MSANAIVARVVNELVDEIGKYLDEKGKLEFDSTASISFADEEMRMIAKNEDMYLLTTLENKNGSEFHHYEIEGRGSVSVYDLI